MNQFNRLTPLRSRLGTRAMVPSRSLFSRRPAINAWGLVERQMEDIDRQFARMERDMNSAFRNFGFPLARVQRYLEPSHDSLFSSRDGMFPVAIETEVSPAAEAGQPGKFIIKVNVGNGFSPDDIKINMKDHLLTIHAKLEHKSEDGHSRVYQEISRSFTLPETVKPDEVKSLFSPEGILTIEAPLPEAEMPQPKEIPISIEAKN